MIIKTGFMLMVSILLSGCAAIQQQARQDFCNPEGAYAKGSNDAQAGQPMAANFAGSLCVAGQYPIAELNQSYRKGYQFMTRQQTQRQRGQITINTGRQQSQYGCLEVMGVKRCGYDCKQAMGKVQCASKPDQYCLSNPWMVACGYQCEDRFGTIRCQATR